MQLATTNECPTGVPLFGQQQFLKNYPGQAALPEYPHGQVIPKQCRDTEFSAISNNKYDFPTRVPLFVKQQFKKKSIRPLPYGISMGREIIMPVSLGSFWISMGSYKRLTLCVLCQPSNVQ